MSLPAMEAVRARCPGAHVAVLARPWVAGLYRHAGVADEILLYEAKRGWASLAERARVAGLLRKKKFDCALLLQNAFDAALLAWAAGIPRRIGYARDGRSLLLTEAVPAPAKGEIPLHESYYYLELLRRTGWLDALPERAEIRLPGRKPQSRPVVGVSPGAAYGSAKRWLPERFAEASAAVARALGATVAVFGSASERGVCQTVLDTARSRGVEGQNYAGATTLEEFIELAAGCAVFLTNDSGAMHVASALGVPTVAVFGATNPLATGPLGPHTRVVRHAVECSPCLLRECPIDHRCMTAVTAGAVAQAALELVRAVR